MNHDLIGIKDLLKRQKQQINRIKFFTRIDNEKYLREHPEIEFIIQQFFKFRPFQAQKACQIQHVMSYFSKI